MARIKFSGLEEYELRLAHLSERTPEIAGRAIYEGAAIVTDAIRANIQGLHAVSDKAGLFAYKEKTPQPVFHRLRCIDFVLYSWAKLC